MSQHLPRVKVGILAGGLGSRLSEETEIRPKPMVEIGGMPIIWHIMNLYSHYGFNDFSIALGYKGELIKRWFRDYCNVSGSVTLRTRSGQLIQHSPDDVPDWDVHLVETGVSAGTGGRIKKLAPWLGPSTAMVTWCDGVADIDLQRLLAFHRSHGRLATLTAVRPPARYGHLEFEGDAITCFSEKPQIGEGWINGAFFVLEPQVMDYIEHDEEMFEQGALARLAEDGQLMAYRHESFWQCMDTMREKKILNDYWESGNAPWKIWEERDGEDSADRASWLHRIHPGLAPAGTRS
ncbi:glucose-1-phosphate cytidylyltransferase [Sphingomonas laterariae]|uniref:Glucose-1-phosphate cytidylyltransferase n=1 Tax=Edaphosphingomonas laterariae TaxID=861865 RepID=A0A239IJP7_9SPHN|nr:glucose-1-phosphate cytidylyltransferase [Sphingomonas laterariae]SNS93870.1 glucose-1-phosphate cytidylyltransferase [Sphingomonas laterariae]